MSHELTTIIVVTSPRQKRKLSLHKMQIYTWLSPHVFCQFSLTFCWYGCVLICEERKHIVRIVSCSQTEHCNTTESPRLSVGNILQGYQDNPYWIKPIYEKAANCQSDHQIHTPDFHH